MKNPLLTILFIISITSAFSTHLRTGHIQVRQHSANSLTVVITVVVYTNTINTQVLFGGEDDRLDFGDGTTMLIPETPNMPRPDLGEGIATASFTVSHTYSSHGYYLISYSEPNRNEGVVNMDGSVSTKFYTETLISLNPGVLFRTPEFQLPPMFVAVFQKQLTRSFTCVDSMRNQLVYELVSPKSNRDEEVMNYTLPEKCSIHLHTGVLSWDTKFRSHYLEGEYAFAVKVSQLDTSNIFIGYMLCDFQIILTDGDEVQGSIIERVNEDEHGRIYVPANETDEMKLIASAPDAGEVSIDVISELENVNDALRVETYDSTSANSVKFKVAKLSLTNKPQVTRYTPYPINVRVTFKKGLYSTTKDLTYLFHTTELKTPPSPPPPPPVVGIEKRLTRDITVYPNPFSEKLFVDIKNNLPANIEIQDLNGKVMFSSTSIPKSVDMSTAGTGLYIVIIQQNKKSTVVKAVKQ